MLALHDSTQVGPKGDGCLPNKQLSLQEPLVSLTPVCCKVVAHACLQGGEEGGIVHRCMAAQRYPQGHAGLRVLKFVHAFMD